MRFARREHGWGGAGDAAKEQQLTSIGYFEVTMMGTLRSLPAASLMLRTRTVRRQCSCLVTLSRTVALRPDSGSVHTKWDQHSPRAGRNGSRATLPGSPPRKRH